uniref:Phosphoinositide phospholipase C n=1 Tax=Monopterus albus TaxID=43700 RepID=A0A3Q3IUN2_MONAL
TERFIDITIDSIHEVCEGKKSELFRRYADACFDPNCCFSIYHGEHVKCLDLVSTNAEEARTWITGLKYLMAENTLTGPDHDPFSFLLNCSLTWLQQTFSDADKNGDGTLSMRELHQLLHKFNVNLPKQKEADTDENQGSLGFEEFCSFYKMISTRLDQLIQKMTFLMLFYLQMQGLTREHLVDIVVKSEPCPENLQRMVLGFTNYMRSPAGDIFNPEHNQVNQDMTQPLCNYFIATSHNTYLTGDQLLSQSRVEMYACVLQAGCRCVEGEVDCWDGPDGEPIIHHGYTLTSKILFKDVIETINKYAFTKSQYPVILSIENHCTVPQQKKIAEYLREVLQDKLDLSSVNVHECKKLPSPEILKGKILVKGDVSDEDTGDEDENENEDENRKTMRLSRALSDLVKYTKSVRVHDIETQGKYKRHKSKHLIFTLVCLNQRQLLRVYPSNYRVDSSNFNPQPYWNAGCHMVAMNYQTEGRMLELNRAKFSSNGSCGYILKPKCMCKGVCTDPLPGHRKTQLVLKIISGQQLPKPRDSIIDPYVEVEITGLPVDCSKQQTRVVNDNGFNPMWEETLVFNIQMPQIALVRFHVWDHDPIGREFIGQRTVAFTSIIINNLTHNIYVKFVGYRHVYLEGMEESSIFVHVAINHITAKVSYLK